MKGSHIKEKATEDKLQKEFKALQQDWESYMQSNPRTLRRCSTDSKAMAKARQLLDCSPRNLMSSLQQKLSPSEGGWKIRNNDLAKEEIFRERKVAIENGLKGRRRLFEDLEDETEMAFGGREKICNGWNGFVQDLESEVRPMSFYNSEDDHEFGGSKDLPVCLQFSSSSSSSSLSSLSGEKVEGEVLEEEKKVVASVETRRVAYGGSGNGRSWMVRVMCWLAIASILYAICIVPMRGLCGYGDENEMLLVPT
jgi:hypothetical protein